MEGQLDFAEAQLNYRAHDSPDFGAAAALSVEPSPNDWENPGSLGIDAAMAVEILGSVFGTMTVLEEWRLLSQLGFSFPEKVRFTRHNQGLVAAYVLLKDNGDRATYGELIHAGVMSIHDQFERFSRENPTAAQWLESMASTDESDVSGDSSGHQDAVIEAGLGNRIDGVFRVPRSVLWVVSKKDILSMRERHVNEVVSRFDGKVAGFIKNILATPHYNARWHIEGGEEAILLDHLNVMLKQLIAIETELEFPDIGKDLQRMILRVNDRSRKLLLQAMVLHDIGKSPTVHARTDGGGYSFPGHERESYRMLKEDRPSFDGMEISDQVIFAVQRHGMHYKMEKASLDEFKAEIARWRNEYSGTMDEFREAMEVLIALTTLDALGSVTRTLRPSSPAPVNNMLRGFEIFWKEQTGTVLDYAMGSGDMKQGGIDFAQSNLDLQIKRDGNGVVLPVSQQNLENIRIDGLVPVILRIQAVAPDQILR